MSVPVPLYVPNILGYVRILLAFVGLAISEEQPLLAVCVWIISALLDLIDGIVARRLQQTSHFGIILDIAADNILRTCIWIATIVSTATSTTFTLVSKYKVLVIVAACCIISLEWFTMVCTQLHAVQFEKHWKSERQNNDPWLLRQVFQNGFKTPLGILTIYGIFATQMWLYGRSHPILYENNPILPTYVYDVAMYTAMAGRLIGLCVEFWLCGSFLRHVVVVQDEEESKKKRTTESRKEE